MSHVRRENGYKYVAYLYPFGQDNVTYLYPFSHICDMLHGSRHIFVSIWAGRHCVMSLRTMSHLWVMAHVWISYSTHMEKKMTHKSEWHDTVIFFPNGYKYRTWLMEDVTNMSKWLINLSDMTHRTEWHDAVISCHVTLIYESWAHVWMSYSTHMNQSWHAVYLRSGMAFFCESCHTWICMRARHYHKHEWVLSWREWRTDDLGSMGWLRSVGSLKF